MKGIIAFAMLALAATAVGTEVDCSQYFTKSTGIACSKLRKPICGTDQKTYSNECMFCIKNKGKGFQLRKLHDNERVQCTGYFEICSMEFIPFCGSDGKQYGNKCSFGNAVAKSTGNLYLKNYGLC